MLNTESNAQSRDPPQLNSASDIVELVVFTTDPMFMQTLREGVGTARRLWQVPSADKVGDLLLAGQVGILVLDVQSPSETASAFVARIKDQFPDLVVVVAGNREAEAALAKLISDGTVYRFIHKPMSPGRAKLFADAAVRKFKERRSHGRPSAAARVLPMSLEPRRLIGVLLALGIIALGGVWIAIRRLHHGPSEASAPAVPLPGVPGILTHEGSAQEITAHESIAHESLAQVRERLLKQAETALLEHRLNEAATAIAAARGAGVESGRISFLTSELEKLREQRGSAPAQVPSKVESRPAPGTSDERRPLEEALQSAEPMPGPAAQRVEQAPPVEPDGTAAREQMGTARQQAADAPAAQADGIESSSVDSQAIPALLSTALQRQRELATVVDAGTLTAVRISRPVYPTRAEFDRIEGWVELEFTVTTSGEVQGISVSAANPPGVFEAAAIGALAHWQYQPVMKDGQPAAQRARIRLRFTLPH